MYHYLFPFFLVLSLSLSIFITMCFLFFRVLFIFLFSAFKSRFNGIELLLSLDQTSLQSYFSMDKQFSANLNSEEHLELGSVFEMLNTVVFKPKTKKSRRNYTQQEEQIIGKMRNDMGNAEVSFLFFSYHLFRW